MPKHAPKLLHANPSRVLTRRDGDGVFIGQNIGKPVRNAASDLQVPDAFALVPKVRQVADRHAQTVGKFDGGKKLPCCDFRLLANGRFYVADAVRQRL